MSEQEDRDLRTQAKELVQEAGEMVKDKALEELQVRLHEQLYDIEALRVDIDARGSLFGFGRRVVVPADEIHVVSGFGVHSRVLSKGTHIFGVAAGKPALYWQNRLTQVIALRTVTFIVPIEDYDVLDLNGVPYTVTAHVVAKVDEDNPLMAAQHVGKDVFRLVQAIQEATQAQLFDQAANLSLEDVMKKRQVLGVEATKEVNPGLKKLGYDLVLINITDLGGEAYERLVKQAQVQVVRDTTQQINTAEVETTDSNKKRQVSQAQMDAITLQRTEEERLRAEQEIRAAQLTKDEADAKAQQAFDLAEQERTKTLASEAHKVAMARVELDKLEQVARVESAAAKAIKEQENQKQIELDAATADAKRRDFEQTRNLARAQEKATQDATRLAQEESAKAQRAADVTQINATAQAEALKISTEADNAARLSKATAEAQAAEKEAAAKLKQAEGTQAEIAAPDLAAADVTARQTEVEGQKVEVERERGMAEAGVERAKADAQIDLQRGLMQVELDRQTAMARLFAEAPTLAELEQLKLKQDHLRQLAQIQADAQVRIYDALAPHMELNFNVIGDGSKASQVMSQIMAIAAGANVIGQQVPAVGRALGTAIPTDVVADSVPDAEDTSISSDTRDLLTERLSGFVPHIQQLVRDMNPRVFTSLTAIELVEALAPVVAGESDLITALGQLKEDAGFRAIADIPIKPFLERLGVTGKVGDTSVATET